jgi:DNA polymerase-3 subunit delta
MTAQQIISDFKKKNYKPIYFLMGEEPYFIDEISDYVAENVLAEHERDFNQTILYGKETNTLSIISEAKRYPMMAERQVVIVKEAQNINDLDKLAPYVEKPQTSTILVLCYKYKTLDKRKSFTKLLDKHAILFDSKKLYDNQLPDWIAQYLKEKGYSIQIKALHMLVEFLGNDLSKITNELGKLMIIVPKGKEISADDIERNIGISKEYNIFELQKALGQKNILKANQIVFYFGANEKDNPLVMVVSALYTYFSKLLAAHYAEDKSPNGLAVALKVNPYFVKEYQQAAKNYSANKIKNIFSYLRETDMKSKGVDNVSASDGELLKELVFKILTNAL